MKKKFGWKLVFNIAVVIFSAALIGYFVFSPDGLSDLIRSDVKISFFWLGAAAFFQLFNIVLDMMITYSFIKVRYKDFSIAQTIKVSMMGQFFNLVTPASTGGQPMQIYYLSKKNIDVGFATGCLMQKLVVWQVCSVIYGFSVLAYNFELFRETLSSPVMWGVIIIGLGAQFFVAAAVLLCVFNEKLTLKLIGALFTFLNRLHILKKKKDARENMENQVEIFHTGSVELLSNPWLMIRVYVMTFIQLTSFFLVPYCVYRAMGLSEKGPVDMVSLQSFVHLISSMIPLPGSTGAAEFSFDRFFTRFFTGETIKTATLIWRIITFYGILAISSPFAFLVKDKNKKKNN